MKSLLIRFLRPEDPRPPATITLTGGIPDDVVGDLVKWCFTGIGKFEKNKKRLTVNVIVLGWQTSFSVEGEARLKLAKGLTSGEKPEDLGHGAAEEVYGSTD